jgi:hypothetical protein
MGEFVGFPSVPASSTLPSTLNKSAQMKFPLVLIFLVASLLSCSAPSRAVSNIDRALFVGRLDDGRSFTVDYIFAPMPAFKGYPDAPKMWTILRELRLKIGGRTVAIPRKAFADLRWPHTPGIPSLDERGDIRLPISGADGEYSYTVYFVIRHGRLVSRELWEHAARQPIISHYRSP